MYIIYILYIYISRKNRPLTDDLRLIYNKMVINSIKNIKH